MRLTIDEYSKHFKMSKEMIHSKLKNKKINYIIENNSTYIIVTQKSAQNINDKSEQTGTTKIIQPSKEIAKPKTTVATILALYQRENQQLKERIVQLETKIDRLIDDKEQMLRNEMQKIEEVYTTKDEQLKTILELVNAKLMLENTNPTVHEVETLEDKEQLTNKENDGLVELRSYIKTLDTKAYQRKIIRKRFLSAHNSDIRIIQKNGKMYLDFSKHDYSDLLKF